MLPDHARLRELFLAACDLPESQQSVMVDEHCADDPELRRELMLLLRTDARKNGIFADDKTNGRNTVSVRHSRRIRVAETHRSLPGEAGLG